MKKLLLPFMSGFLLISALNAYSQGLDSESEKLEEIGAEISQDISQSGNNELEEAANQDMEKASSEEKASSGEVQIAEPVQTDDSLWQETQANLNLVSLSEYLAAFPNGKHSDEARATFRALEEKVLAQAKEDKALDAYRKRRIANGLVLELGGALDGVKPYVRSMLNSCGYTLAKSHRFAKRVYPTLVIRGKTYTGKSDAEHTVTLDLSVTLKTTTREIKAREKMRSYRTSPVDTHQALIAAFEDVGAQMESGGFCKG